MRGERRGQVGMLTLMSPERLVPRDHPIRRIKALADAELVVSTVAATLGFGLLRQIIYE